MRTLFVVHYPVFGGPHNQALRLDRPLAARGWETIVLIPDEPGNANHRLTESGLNVIQARLHRLRAKPSVMLQWNFLRGFWTGVRAIRRIIREQRVDTVMIGGLVNPHAAIAARLEGVPVVWQILDTRTPRPLVRLLMPIVKRLADSVLVTGMGVANAHPGATGFGPRLFSFFPPVDTEQFQLEQRNRRSARDELGIAGQALVIGSVSNVNPQKDQMTFVRAAGRLRQTDPGLRFLILGARYPEHAQYSRDLEAEARAVGLTIGEDLLFHDPGSDVERFASALDIFWLTSGPRSEGIPTVIEEAMSLGLPVVTTDVGSVRDTVLDGTTGFVVAPRDPQAIADATRKLIGDPQLRSRFGDAARKRAVETFSVERCADIHVAAFDAALAHNRERRRKPGGETS
ncbi:MAG: glycosyltransferase [Solirubrobacterales bacterium]